MTDPDTPTTEQPAPAPAPAPSNPAERLLSQANITTGLAVLAVILAGAPYVVPQLQAFQVRGGLMAQPVILEQASKQLIQQHADEAAKVAVVAINAHQTSLFSDASDPVLGNPKGTIKVVEFLDYNCGYCRASTPLVKQFLADNPDVALIVKEYPVISTNSRPLASYALAASAGGQYEAVHYALMTSHVKSDTDMADVLKTVGLDAGALKAKAASPAVQDHIDKVLKLGNDLGVDGTPTFIVGDRMVNGADINSLQAAVLAQRAPAKKG